jgi:hypothetical protein
MAETEWLLGELDKAIAALESLPRKKPQSRKAAAEYAAGLYAMAVWVREKLIHERDWQGLRAFFPGIPEHGSELVIKNRDSD